MGERTKATFDLAGHDTVQEPLVTEMAFCVRGCVWCTVSGPTSAGRDRPKGRAEQRDWAGEDLMLFSGSLHHPQTLRDTNNQLYLLILISLLSHLTGPRGDYSLFPHFLKSHTHTKTLYSSLSYPYIVGWPVIGHGGVSTSLKNRANYPCFFCFSFTSSYLERQFPLHFR